MDANKKKHGGRFPPGTSGNPKGRPRGVGEVSKLRASIAAHIPAIIKALVARALDGDPQAAKLLLERTIPALKPADLSAPLALSGDTLTEQGAAIFEAVAKGAVTPEQGRALLAGLDTLARLRESDEFERRLARLEGVSDADA
jgi:hypothetical protein